MEVFMSILVIALIVYAVMYKNKSDECEKEKRGRVSAQMEISKLKESIEKSKAEMPINRKDPTPTTSGVRTATTKKGWRR